MNKLALVLFFISTLSSAKLCKKWGEHKKIGSLDHSYINESSGIIFSKNFNRLYHVNDSGDGPFFYQTSLTGLHTKKIEIANFSPFDVESMAYGRCGNINCLVIADIGDNREARKTISFTFIEELENFPKKINPLTTVIAQYPDQPHNVEGVAMHPNGNIFILTKAVDYNNNKAIPSKVFVLEKSQWSQNNKNLENLKYLGEIDFPYYLYDFNLWGRIVTGFDIDSTGTKILVSTYKAALEINIDLNQKILNTRQFVLDRDITVTPLTPLLQIESISYLNDDSYIYTTEFHKIQGPSPLIKVECLEK